MKLVEISVRRPVAVTMAVLAVLVMGFVSFTQLSIDLMPKMDLPYVAVFTPYPGAGPEEVEQTVSQPMEEAVSTVENVTDVISMSTAGNSTVYVGFDWGTDMDFATLKMRERVDMYKAFLPSGADNPMVAEADMSMMPVSIYGMSGGQDLETLRRTAEDVVKPRLERIEGVASVGVQGGSEREIQVLLDPERMNGYGVSVAQVVQALRMENLNQSGGKVQEGSKDYLIRIPGEFYDLKDIEGTTVYAGQVPVPLTAFATVEDTFKENATVSRMNGNPSVGITVSKEPTANTVDVAKQVREVINQLEKELPGGVVFEVALDQAEYIEESINSMVSHIVIGGLLAVFAIFLFLRSLRSTLIIATSIPFAVIATFTLIYFSGGTLNLLTLGGLALGIGIIVDDAIVVLENIFRHREEGKSMFEAATFGASEVGGAVLGATTTGIAVFVPIVFVEGLASQLFGPMGMTISFAIFASFIAAVTLVPMIAARLLVMRPATQETRAPGPIGRILNSFGRLTDRLGVWYAKALDWGMGRRRRVVALAAGIFVASLFLIPIVGAEFMPAVDEGQVSIELKMPRGSSLETTDAMVSRVEELAKEIPEVDTTMVTLGMGSMEQQMGGMAGSSADSATIDLMLSDKDERDRSAQEIADELRQQLAGIPGTEFNVTTSTGMMSMTAGGDLMIQIKGDDLDRLDGIADEAVELIKSVEGTREVESDLNAGRPEIVVDVDRQRAAGYGLSVGYVASAINAAMNGEVATRYRVGGDEIDVRVLLAQTARENFADLENLSIITPMGDSVRLQDLATFTVGEGPTAINRYDQVRTATITAAIAGRDLNSVVKDVQSKLGEIPLPPGYSIEYTGAAEEMMDAFGNLGLALVLAILLVYMLLAIQFENLLAPLAVMFSVPVSLTGVVLGLLVTGRTFSVPAFIGAIVCVGVVVKNAIVLVDYITVLRSRGTPREEAIKIAGPVRLRPILMTATATCMAMFPLALGFGEGGEMSAPMATVIIGGLVFSTLVSLLLVPAVYSILDDLGQKVMRRFRRINGTVDQSA